jgi:hypothetical protein
VLRLKKNSKLLSGLRNLWQFQNSEKAKQLRGYRWEEGRMKVFGADHKKNSLILRALGKLELEKFLVEDDRTFCDDSSEVLAVAKWGESEKAKMLGLEIGGQRPIQYLQSLLAHLGIKLVKIHQKEGKRYYSYKPDGGSLPADFKELYAAVSSKMLERYEEKVEKKVAEKRSSVSAGTVDSTSVEVLTPLTNISIDKVARGVTEFEENLEAPVCLPEVVASPELPLPQVPIANLMPWFQRGKEWIKCRVLEFVGGCYRLEAKSMVDDGLVRFRAYPEDLRWEAPT